jgi:hypothetical protein
MTSCRARRPHRQGTALSRRRGVRLGHNKTQSRLTWRRRLLLLDCKPFIIRVVWTIAQVDQTLPQARPLRCQCPCGRFWVVADSASPPPVDQFTACVLRQSSPCVGTSITSRDSLADLFPGLGQSSRRNPAELCPFSCRFPANLCAGSCQRSSPSVPIHLPAAAGLVAESSHRPHARAPANPLPTWTAPVKCLARHRILDAPC